jgi:hypothetical protein
MYQAWNPPSDMVELGRVILSTFSQLNPMINELITALDLHLSTSDQLSRSAHQDSSRESSQERDQSLAQRIYQLHIEATKDGRWIDVQGWRLSEVEVAGYALIALKTEG